MGHVKIDAGAMQMASVDVSLQAVSQACSKMLEAHEALRQYTLPCLRLRNIMHLAGTCRGWHQLITDTPLHQLSEEARRLLLPSGLNSSLPLPQLVKQQAQLLARLRGKGGFTPGIQRLSLKDDALDGKPHNQCSAEQVCTCSKTILRHPLVALCLPGGCKPMAGTDSL